MSTIIGDIITIGGSSNSGDIYALISITYPSGSTCICSNGTTTLTAATTTGQVCFAIPEPTNTPETWTVSCSSGGSSASTTVSISSKGQVESVTLAYVTIISFYIGENEYHAESGMTWAQWLDSGYNTIGAIPSSSGASNIYTNNSWQTVLRWSSTDLTYVLTTDVVVENHTYVWYQSGIK